MTEKLKKMTISEIESHIKAEIIRKTQVAEVFIVSIRFDWLCVNTNFNSFLVVTKVGEKDTWYNMTYSDEKGFTIKD